MEEGTYETWINGANGPLWFFVVHSDFHGWVECIRGVQWSCANNVCVTKWNKVILAKLRPKTPTIEFEFAGPLVWRICRTWYIFVQNERLGLQRVYVTCSQIYMPLQHPLLFHMSKMVIELIQSTIILIYIKSNYAHFKVKTL